MSVQIIEIISLIIRIATVFVVYGLLKKMIDRIKELEKDIESLSNELRYTKSEVREFEPMFKRRDDLFEQLVAQLDKRVSWGWTRGTVLDLTDSEKIAKKLRQEADELEREEE